MKSQNRKLPRLYKEAAWVLERYKNKEGSLKKMIYQSGHPNIHAVSALVQKAIQNASILTELFKATPILRKTNLNRNVAEIMLTELFWGKKRLPENASVSKLIKKYQKSFEMALQKIEKTEGLTKKMSSVTAKPSIPRYVRINTLYTNLETVIFKLESQLWEEVQYDPKQITFDGFLQMSRELMPQQFLRDYHFPDLLVFHPTARFYDMHMFIDGHICVSDKASYIPPHVLSPPPGSVVMDACAAPGMKAVHTAIIMKNQGHLYTVDRDSDRCKTLHDIMMTAKVDCTTLINKDFMSLDPAEYPDVEYILVDPSCSGSGIIQRVEPEKVNEPSRISRLSNVQAQLLRHALSFPSVKRVVYSTCSIHWEENEKVVEEVLAPPFQLMPVLPDTWEVRGEGSKLARRCLRADWDRTATNGFFVAVFEREELQTKKIKAKSSEDLKHEIVNPEKKTVSKASDANAKDVGDKLKVKKSINNDWQKRKVDNIEAKNTNFQNKKRKQTEDVKLKVTKKPKMIETKKRKKKKKNQINNNGWLKQKITRKD